MVENSPNAAAPSRGEPTVPAPFRSLRDELDRMFHALTLPEMDWRSGFANLTGDVVGLRVDVSETDSDIQITADMPGLDEADIDVSLVDDLLRIRGEKHSEQEKRGDDKTWHVIERSYGTFERAIRVPAGTDADQIKATFDKGVLTVTLPKPSAATNTVKKIAVTAG